MPSKGKRKSNPGKRDKLCPPLKTRLPVTGHPSPPSPTLPGHTAPELQLRSDWSGDDEPQSRPATLTRFYLPEDDNPDQALARSALDAFYLPDEDSDPELGLTSVVHNRLCDLLIKLATPPAPPEDTVKDMEDEVAALNTLYHLTTTEIKQEGGEIVAVELALEQTTAASTQAKTSASTQTAAPPPPPTYAEAATQVNPPAPVNTHRTHFPPTNSASGVST